MALKNIAALWKGKPGSKAVLSGYMETGERGKKGPRVMVFKNEDATDENRKPHYRLVQADEDGDAL